MSWWGNDMRSVDADDAVAVPLITCCGINYSSDATAVHFGSWRTQIDWTVGCDDILISVCMIIVPKLIKMSTHITKLRWSSSPCIARSASFILEKSTVSQFDSFTDIPVASQYSDRTMMPLISAFEPWCYTLQDSLGLRSVRRARV